MVEMRLAGIRKSYGATEVIKGVDLDISHGEFIVFVGPSGCGKSTLLRMIAGLEDITAGDLFIGGKRCNDVQPRDRGIAMVFQSYALYPHMTSFENIAFGLTLAKRPRAEINERVREAARILQMEHLLDRKPAQLSGGQRQRVAIGRAIVRKPEAFLFDEPLSNLDASLRMDMRMEIAKLHGDLGATMIYVTHDQVEAMTLADKIVVLDAGVVQQIGSPMDLYNHPANRFVAGFIGSPKMNFLEVRVTGIENGTAMVHSPDLDEIGISVSGSFEVGEPAILGIRPQYLGREEIGPVGGALSGTVRIVERLGTETIVKCELSSGAFAIAALESNDRIGQGDPINIFFDPANAHLFPAR
jgi:multiple sugar transport system ATP-binding protein